jgi:hypothetical protein
MKIINEVGLQEIAAFLLANHNTGANIVANKPMVQAWANEAEMHMLNGNPPSVEIRARHSVTGATQEFTVSEAGVTLIVIEDK